MKITSNSKENGQKTQSTETVKTSFFKKKGTKCRFTQIHIKQNNDYARVKHKIRFWSPLKKTRLL